MTFDGDNNFFASASTTGALAECLGPSYGTKTAISNYGLSSVQGIAFNCDSAFFYTDNDKVYLCSKDTYTASTSFTSCTEYVAPVGGSNKALFLIIGMFIDSSGTLYVTTPDAIFIYTGAGRFCPFSDLILPPSPVDSPQSKSVNNLLGLIALIALPFAAVFAYYFVPFKLVAYHVEQLIKGQNSVTKEDTLGHHSHSKVPIEEMELSIQEMELSREEMALSSLEMEISRVEYELSRQRMVSRQEMELRREEMELSRPPEMELSREEMEFYNQSSLEMEISRLQNERFRQRMAIEEMEISRLKNELSRPPEMELSREVESEIEFTY